MADKENKQSPRKMLERKREKTISKFKGKYPEFDPEKFIDIVNNGSLDEIKELAVAYNTYPGAHYTKELSEDKYSYYSYESKIKEALNNKVNLILGADMANLFTQLVKEHGYDLWNGDERYTIFLPEPVYYVKKVLKTLMYLKFEYLGNELTLDNIKEISRLYKHGVDLCDIIYIPRKAYNGQFKERTNFEIQREINAWVQFDDYILTGELDKAYKLLKEYSSKWY